LVGRNGQGEVQLMWNEQLGFLNVSVGFLEFLDENVVIWE
jgi:hypothetical protein